MFVTHLPEARGIRIGGHTFKHHGRRAIGKRPVNDISVPGDPAHICGAPIDIFFFQIENIVMSDGNLLLFDLFQAGAARQRVV